MTGTAGYITKVNISLDNSTWVAVEGSNVDLDRSTAEHDVTDFANNVGFTSRLLGLKDWSMSLDVHYTRSNPAIVLMDDAWLTNKDIYIQYLPSETVAAGDGFTGKCLISNIKLGAEVNGVTMANVSIMGNGVITVAV